MNKSRFIISVLSVVMICGGLAHAGPPVIKNWSSTGCKTFNKTGPKDRMYLVEFLRRRHRDKDKDKDQVIVFNVKASGAEKYVWQVNKKVVKDATGNTLTWAVPRRTKAIWEIHVTAGNKDGSAHAEWVVSTLDKAEAPEIFEYFTDAKFDRRAETDPWGRTPPNWYSVSDQPRPDSTRRFLQTASSGAPDDENNINSTLYLPSDITYGTWIFKFLLPAARYDGYGGWTHLRFCFINAEEDMPPFWYTRSQDSHNYTGVGHENRIDHDIGWAPVRKLWQEVRIIRTKDGGLYTWADGVFQFRGRELRGKQSASMSIKLAHFRPDRDPTGVMCIDMVEVYRDKYLFPPKSVRYGQYIHDWTWRKLGPVEIDRWFDFDKKPTLFRIPPRSVAINMSRYRLKRNYGNCTYVPALKDGIVVNGRGVRLKDIPNLARRLGHLFRYDRKTKTAVCSTNLVINEGAELILDGETLKFDCKTPGQHEFVVMFGSTLNVKNSTITTTNENHFNWRLDGMTHFGYRCGPIHSPIYTGPSYISNLWYHGMCSLFLHGSTINNFAYMFISSPMQVDITDTKFTNIHEVDTAEYNRLWGRKDYPGGATRGIRNRFKGDKGFWIGLFGDKTNGFNVRGLTFSGSKSPLGLTFFANDDDYESFNVYDIKAPKENIVVRKGYRIRGYAKPIEAESTVGLVNSKFAKIVVPTDKARAVVKYYLNVEVTDASGKIIPDVKITVINEGDDKTYPAVNEDGTWIIADYVQDQAGKKEFTYTVEVTTPDGKKASIRGVNPDASWYRADGRKKAMTIKVTVK